MYRGRRIQRVKGMKVVRSGWVEKYMEKVGWREEGTVIGARSEKVLTAMWGVWTLSRRQWGRCQRFTRWTGMITVF